MDEKIKELIAVGASVAAHCQPCLDWHLEQARGQGAMEDEIRTALHVGFMVEDRAGKAKSELAGSWDKCCSGGSSCDSEGGCCC